ncbi:MAG TPA: hypothetical protein VIY86_14095 [Pirellulaceae bacterium]
MHERLTTNLPLANPRSLMTVTTATIGLMWLLQMGHAPATGIESANATFRVTYASSDQSDSFDGRLLLVLSSDDKDEPRFQVIDTFRSQQIFGQDVEEWTPGEPVTIDARAFGYPKTSLAEIPAGRYRVQAVLHKYETFHRGDGHTVKLPMDRGEGQQWSRAPGNLHSSPTWIDFDPAASNPIEIKLDQVIPPIPDPADTKYIKHIRIPSKLLSEFWGRPMYLGAHVLLPEGFEEHPQARYPLMIFHGHFTSDLGGFRPEPPDANLEPDYSERFKLKGYNRIQQEYAHQFYREWVGPGFPRVILIEIQHANPYYDDSYAVNSANLGPYGDAITYELIPEVERRFRGLGKGWARFMYGGSTGGWEALAAQVFYPDEYNGCYAACPDPIDFRAYTVINIYEDENAYYQEGPFGRVLRPGMRNNLGHISSTLESLNRMELALGTHSRSGQQWDIWQAVYSPVGSDGYPKPIWDKLKGTIDREVAEYWREHYDLVHIMQRDWKSLGPKLHGKIHLYCGDMDNYYLNNAVYLAEDFLRSAEPPFSGEVDYGDRAEHCWNGDHTRDNAYSRLRYHQMFIPKAIARLRATAPTGADLTSWDY